MFLLAALCRSNRGGMADSAFDFQLSHQIQKPIHAAIALDHRAVLFTVDQHFSRVARITRLQLYSNY